RNDMSCRGGSFSCSPIPHRTSTTTVRAVERHRVCFLQWCPRHYSQEALFMLAPRNILAATDFSAASETALQYARELARAFGSTLHVLHVVSEATPEAIPAAYMPETGNTYQAILDEAREQLHEIATARDLTNVALTEHLMTSPS